MEQKRRERGGGGGGDLPQLLLYYLTYQWVKMLCGQKEVLKSFLPV